MKRWLFLFILLPIHCFAASWFVSSTGNDAAAGTSSGTAFKTITKVQTVYHANDIIQINRDGGTYIVPPSFIISGGQLTTYGTGRMPILSGLDDISGWINLGGNIWEATDLNLGTTVNILLINGTAQQPARFPKASYLTYTSGTATALTAASPISATYADGNVVFKKNHFAVCSYKISSIVGSTINYTGGGGQSPTNNYGFFVQNSRAAVTAQNDWYYDGAGHIYMYSTTMPTNVQASRVSNLLTITGNSTIVTGIKFVGANLNGITTNNRSTLNIHDNVIVHCGVDGQFHNNLSNSVINSNRIDSCNNAAVIFATYTNITFNNDTLQNIGLIPGLGQNIDGAGSTGSYTGLGACCQTGSSGLNINNIQVAFTGYNGLTLKGLFNLNGFGIHDYCSVMDDGGGVYTDVGQSSPVVYPSNRTISNGVVWNGIGSPQGTANGLNEAVGVYCDDNTSNLIITNVTSYNNGQYCFFLHNSHDVQVTNCTGFNGVQAVLAMVKDNLTTTRLYNISLSNNIFVGNGTQYVAILKCIAPTSVASDLTTWGTSVNARYANNATTTSPFLTQLFSQPVVNRTFAGWQLGTGQDLTGSTYVTVPSPNGIYPNPTSSSSPITLTNIYKDLLGNSYSVVVNIGAYSALYLYYFSPIPPSPPSISYVPSSYTFYVNEPISPVISPINVGGTATSFTISPTQSSGILFGTSNGQISGTPLSLSPSQSYTITAFNGGGSSPTNLVLAVIARPPIVSYTPSVQVATINVPITPFVPSSTGGAVVSWSISPALPTGVSQNVSTGLISGTPTILSPVTLYTAVAHNSGGNTPTNVTLSVVNPAPLPPHIAFSPSTYVLPISVPISTITPISTGGNVDSFSISTSLPALLNFDTTLGTISGTPTVLSGATGYTITAHNASGDFPATVTISVINTTPAPPSISYTPSSATFQKNIAIVSWHPVNLGGASSSWSISPPLPSSLSFNTSNGTISGTATVLSPLTSYHVSAVNGGGTGGTNIQIRVANPPPRQVIRVRSKYDTVKLRNRH